MMQTKHGFSQRQTPLTPPRLLFLASLWLLPAWAMAEEKSPTDKLYDQALEHYQAGNMRSP